MRLYEKITFLCFFVLVIFFLPSGQSVTGGDFAQYLMQSEVFLNENTMDDVHSDNIKMMDSRKHGPYLYPSLYSIIISPLTLFEKETSFFVIKILNLLFIFFAIIVFLKPSIKNHYSMIFYFMLFNLNFIVKYSSQIYPDIFYLSLLFLASHFILKKTKSFLDYIIPIFIAFISIFTKTIGIIFLFTTLIITIFEKSKAKTHLFKIMIISIIIFASSIYLRSNLIILAGDSSNELNSISFNYFSRNLTHYVSSLSQMFFENSISFSRNILIDFCLLTFGIILIIRSQRKTELFKLTILLAPQILPIFIFEPQQGTRYLLPCLPIIFHLLNESHEKYLENKFILFLCIIMILYNVNMGFRNKNIGLYDNVLGKNETELFDYINSNTDLDCTICFRKPRVMKYFTNRISTSNCNDKNLPVDFIVLFKNKRHKYWSELPSKKYTNLVYENSKFSIYNIDK